MIRSISRIIILGAAVISYRCAYSQSYDNNWVFGDSAGLNFSTDPPLAFHTKIRSHESCASISDSEGNLLFYTNGEKVWNRINEVMPDGDSLNIGLISGTNPSSITQGVVIVPNPALNDQYYIFYITTNTDSGEYGLEYSIVDMNLDGGFGDVTLKNVSVYTGYLVEKLQAVKHGNGRDWWVIVHHTYNPDIDSSLSFIRVLLTPDSVMGPFTQFYDPDGSPHYFGSAGQMKFSQNGSRLAFTSGTEFDLFDFDRCSGEFSNRIIIKDLIHGNYGCEFSTDGRKLYTSWAGLGNGTIYQYDLDIEDSIKESEVAIFKLLDDNHSVASLQIGPDEKIYAPFVNSIYADGFYTDFNQAISIINYPILSGLSCDFDTLSIPLINARSTMTLPNMPNYSLGPLVGSECDTLLAIHNTPSIKNEIKIYPNPATETVKIFLQHPEIILAIKTFNYLGEEINLSFDEDLIASVKNLPAGFYATEIITENGKVGVSWEKL